MACSGELIQCKACGCYHPADFACEPYIPATKEEADEAADNGRNTGGKSYYRPRKE